MNRILLAALLPVAVSACNPITDNLGNRTLKEDSDQIKVGQTTRNEVQRLLGSPSSTAPLDDSTWYYISARQVQWAFMRPSTTEQQVLVIKFDSAGIVRDMKQMDKDDGQDVALVTRTTPTRGGEPGLLRSLYDTLVKGPITRKAEDAKKARGPDL